MTYVKAESIELKRLFLFFFIAFAFTWFFWIPDALYKMGVIPASPLTGLGFIGAFGPLVAAVLVTGIFERGAGLKTLFTRAFDTHFRKI